MDPAVLLQSKSDDSPSGENLEYETVFTEMELAAQPIEEQQVGDAKTEGHEPDYREVIKKALLVLEQSHDLRAGVFLADAILNIEGLKGYADATTVLRGHVEQFWDTCHPELDEDDDNDPTMRVNAIQGLCGQPGGMAGPSLAYRSLRRVALTESRGFGRFSMRDIEVSEGQIALPEGETGPDTAAISAAFQDTDDDVLAETLAAVQTASENIRAISAVFDEKTPGRGPELDPLVKLLDQMARRLGEYTSADDPTIQVDDSHGDADAPAAAATSAAPTRAVGSINSRSDVTNALDRIVGYYRQHEPSSPVPILLERAKRLVNADFLTIIQDIAPNEFDNVKILGGIDND
ncbi:type VI secretion system protein TssA [Sedimentitalea todarodis]|uniref:Type VI secretion system protein TssA n=1 Tax=Sedimentitalea todarodis TaxID=1631240 RepID=A0ABU3VJQ0_9RHOB|nr:type VI secretion system protein TssA [Sedimentitalea todarodis]MDU9005939.1 type VI secretion system protein TssA [Sedimentitalea todarodis]